MAYTSGGYDSDAEGGPYQNNSAEIGFTDKAVSTVTTSCSLSNRFEHLPLWSSFSNDIAVGLCSVGHRIPVLCY